MYLILTNILADFTLCLPNEDSGILGTQYKVDTKPLFENENDLLLRIQTQMGTNFIPVALQSGTAVLRNPKPYRVVFTSRGDAE
jgi:hypothetical protein